MAGMVPGVIHNPQHSGRKCIRQGGAQPFSAGLHGVHIVSTPLAVNPPVANSAWAAHITAMMTRRPTRPRAYAPDPAAPGRTCDMPGCAAQGEYRAPKSRRNLREYWWFCLEHVRAYNLSWDYYKGMTPAQIEAELRRDTAWQRPSWPLGRLGSYQAWDDEFLRDPLQVLAGAPATRRAEAARQQAPRELREPLAILGLDWPTTLAAVKLRYKELAKRYHPDANGGSRESEEQLKTINLAYAMIRSRLLSEPRLAATG